MEKESYETFEYLPESGSNSEAEPYQFFVVQDDGTFLINRQVQYVTQVQADKEALEGGQPCTILDVAPQQFYVDVDTTAEMVSVPEQFSIPEGTSNLYASSYLLQPGSGTPVEHQIGNNVAEQLKANLRVDSSIPVTNKQTNSLTEITLTDEQYGMLEQKELIQKLKTDETPKNLIPEPSQLKIEYPSSLRDIDVQIPNGIDNESKLESPQETECATDLSLMVDESKEDETDQKLQWDEKKFCAATDAMHATLVDNLYEGVCEKWKDGNVLRIRTDFCLKDIPDKIFLGKTKTGKRLVCKVLKPDKKQTKNSETETDPGPALGTVQNSIPSTLTDVDDSKLDSIFRKCFEESTVKYNSDDVTVAEKVVKQLLRLPAVKTTIVNRNMLVTKVIINEKDTTIIESFPTLVTGKVISLNKEWRFLHKPDLYTTAKQELIQALNENVIDHNFLHMHIHEIQHDDKIVRTAVTLNKRRLEVSSTQHSEKIFIPDLPLHTISNADTDNTMYGYACGICAAIFQTESELNDHRETHKLNTDDNSTVNTQEDNFAKNGILVLTDPYNKSKKYACIQCNANFQRLHNCQRHVKTHLAPVENESSDDKKRVYKCKICYSFFHHAPTLLKHIMKNHIKVDK